MKVLILCLLASIAYGKITTTVQVNAEAIDASGKNSIDLPCEFTIETTGSENNQPELIYWIKGVSVDDPDAVVMFKGYRYWNESLGEYREFFNGYESRAEVDDLLVPTLTLTGLSSADEGRYWCMVAEWSGRSQSGTDADSVAVLFNNKNFVVSSTPYKISIDEEEDTSITCTSKGAINFVSWWQGPFHLADNDNFTHTEIGSYRLVGTRDLATDEVLMNADFAKLNIDSKMTLIIPNAVISDVGRYWCEVTNTKTNYLELETARHSTEFSVILPEFTCEGKEPGTYPDPADCSMFYECVAGNPDYFHRSCGYDGLVFNPEELFCDWAANVPPPCGTATN